MKIENKKNNSGFTLIELMVATSIFIIIMLAAMGALFMLLDAAKSSRALRSAMDNVNFSMESMTRSIRMGTNYYCVVSGSAVDLTNLDSTKDCSNGGTLLTFIPQNKNSRVGYMLKARGDTKNTYTLQRCELLNGNTNCVDIVSPDVNIEKLKFFVKGAEYNESSPRQPSIYIIMKGTVMVRGVPTSFALQTMASQRNF